MTKKSAPHCDVPGLYLQTWRANACNMGWKRMNITDLALLPQPSLASSNMLKRLIYFMGHSSGNLSALGCFVECASLYAYLPNGHTPPGWAASIWQHLTQTKAWKRPVSTNANSWSFLWCKVCDMCFYICYTYNILSYIYVCVCCYQFVVIILLTLATNIYKLHQAATATPMSMLLDCVAQVYKRAVRSGRPFFFFSYDGHQYSYYSNQNNQKTSKYMLLFFETSRHAQPDAVNDPP